MSETKTDIFSLNEVPVVLTYSGLGVEPITFFLRPFLAKEDQDLRQAYFALTEKEREGVQFTHNVEMLARLSTRDPEGLPGYPLAVAGTAGGSVSESLRAFLTADSPMKVKVAGDAMTRYYRVTQPAEFFRSV